MGLADDPVPLIREGHEDDLVKGVIIMKVTVIGSHLCPDTLYALNRLSEAKAEIDFKNLSASLSDLKAYLALRQDSPAYADIRANGGIGIPCFILEDGTVTRDLDAVLK